MRYVHQLSGSIPLKETLKYTNVIYYFHGLSYHQPKQENNFKGENSFVEIFFFSTLFK